MWTSAKLEALRSAFNFKNEGFTPWPDEKDLFMEAAKTFRILMDGDHMIYEHSDGRRYWVKAEFEMIKE